MQFDESKILSISRDLWSTQLGLDLAPALDDAATNPRSPLLSTCIRVSGEWDGTILLECPESIARHAAAMLFASDGEEPSTEEFQDAVGELAHMIAAKIQPLLSCESTLSRPVRANGEALIGMRGVGDLRLSCEGHPVRIALYEAETQPASAA